GPPPNWLTWHAPQLKRLPLGIKLTLQGLASAKLASTKINAKEQPSRRRVFCTKCGMAPSKFSLQPQSLFQQALTSPRDKSFDSTATPFRMIASDRSVR